MNDINFSTPNGFPLEADATLGFMQSDYRRAIEAMAIFVSEGKNVILSGVNYYQSAGQTYYSEGWVVTQYGQLMRFVGGVAQTTCCLEETIVQKPNADGTLVSRYYTRRMVFGAGALQVNFSDFKRIEGNNSLTNALQGIVGFESAVILRGCDVFNLDTNASTLEITEGLAMIEGRLFTVPTYSGAYPVYFDMANGITNWTTNTVGLQLSAIAFDPYTSQYYADVTKRKLTPKDEIKTIVALSTMFDGTGLGRHSWKGFALCNGENGTVDLRGRTIFGSPPVRDHVSNGKEVYRTG